MRQSNVFPLDFRFGEFPVIVIVYYLIVEVIDVSPVCKLYFERSNTDTDTHVCVCGGGGFIHMCTCGLIQMSEDLCLKLVHTCACVAGWF